MSERISYPGSLHNHDEFSNLRLRDCIIKVEDLIDYAIELGHEVVAITNHDCISGAVRVEKYYKKIKENHPNFKVIQGNEIYLCRNGLNASNYKAGQDKYYHFILLAKDAIGHKQIREISTRAWLRSYMARGMRRVPTYYNDLFEIIGANPGHVIGSTACLGGCLPTQLLKAKDNPELMPKIHNWINQMDNLFGHGNFFFEMQPSNNKEQIYVNKKLFELSNEFEIPYIITTDTHYLKKEDRAIHKAYLNAQNGDREVDDFYATTYLMDTEELESYFGYFSQEQLQIAYRNILKIKDMCEDYSLLKPLYIPQLPWKESRIRYVQNCWIERIPYLKTFVESDYVGDQVLACMIVEALEDGPQELWNQKTWDEVNACLEMTWISSNVNKAHWSAYYLNLQRIIEECWKAGTLVGPGRGSGVGFILLYLLNITQINPLQETTKTFRWRFLNPDRVSVLDVDVDIEGGRRADVLNHLRKVYGDNRVSNVATFRQEKSKSAILTACRGLGIDVDIASYLASLIPSDRGLLRTLSQCMYGDTENDWKPIKQFVYEMTENYPEVWEVAQKIEGLICGYGIHAGGVIFVDEPFTNSTGLMRAPDGTIITAFDLHACEDVSLIKYDLLSVEALDKIHNCLDLLVDYGYVKKRDTLKETYESVIGIYNLERTAQDMWKMVWDHKITSLFQMEKQSGINGIALTHPQSVDDLAVLNSVIRLMAQEKGAEQPLNKFARFKNDISLWYKEMENYGLTKEEMKILEPVVKISYGICESQEKFMELVQLPECGGFSLTWADKLRKSIAKKNPKAFLELQDEYFRVIKEKGLDEKFCKYVWNVLVCMSKGYGFNASHTLAYSLIALQEMNLAYCFPIIFWNCACLISDSGGNEGAEEDEEDDTIEETYVDCVEEFEDDNDDDEDDEEEVVKEKKKKKKTKTTNYGKISSAIGKMKMSGIDVAPPDVNKSTYTFSPDVEKSIIRFGMSGIVKVGEDIVKSIIENRPYSSIDDFLSKVKINKPQMINLIKAGAFDEFGDRESLMRYYVSEISDTKKRITLQNMKMLIDFGLIPDEYDLQRRVFNFNKYLKKMKIGTQYYGLDNIAMNFYEKNFDVDFLEPYDTESGFAILQTKWDKIYKAQMDIVRPFIKDNNQLLLNEVNNRLMSDVWNKYCLGSISKWEMDSVSCYFHQHELQDVNYRLCGFSNFFELSEQPEIDRIIEIKGKKIPLFKIHRICGTVLDRDKGKKMVTVLTREGVVNVRVFGEVFSYYDKQISERGADGKKHVIEKSIFSRGNKIIITGIRRENEFVMKKYKNTPYHGVELITKINEDGTIESQGRIEQ